MVLDNLGNGFVRESEGDRAKFDGHSFDDWEIIGAGKIPLVDKDPLHGHKVNITEYILFVDGFAEQAHINKEFIAQVELHFHLNSLDKYPRGNWKKSLSIGRTINSIIRHTVQAIYANEKQKHAVAIAANALILWQTIRNLDND